MPAIFDDYTAVSDKPVAEAAAAVAARAQAKGFTLLHVHDFQALLAAAGIAIEPVTLVEICRPRFGSQLLRQDYQMSLLMPCRVAIYRQDGRTRISALRPRLVADLFPSLEALVAEEDALMRAIVEEAK